MADVNNDSSSGQKPNGEGSSATGGSQEFVPPNDGSWIPRERVNEMVSNAVNSATSNLGREVSELRGRLEQQGEQLKSANAAPKATREQIRARVEAGEMSEAEANDYLLEQRLNDMKSEIVESITTTTAQQQRESLVTEQIKAYQAKVPSVMAAGSPERTRVVQEFDYLTKTLGMPPDGRAELQALRSVLGPVESLGNKADGTPEHHQETSGSGGGDESQGGSQNTDGAPSDLSSAEKKYYADQIEKGIYKDWDAVKAELKYANTHLRQRMGARTK